MDPDWSKLLGAFECRAAAVDDDIIEARKQLKRDLPADYVSFLRHSNGGEGFIGKTAYATLWPVEELAELNASYQAHVHAPGFVAFGSDGGGSAFGFGHTVRAMPGRRDAIRGDGVERGDRSGEFVRGVSAAAARV